MILPLYRNLQSFRNYYTRELTPVYLNMNLCVTSTAQMISKSSSSIACHQYFGYVYVVYYHHLHFAWQAAKELL